MTFHEHDLGPMLCGYARTAHTTRSATDHTQIEPTHTHPFDLVTIELRVRRLAYSLKLKSDAANACLGRCKSHCSTWDERSDRAQVGNARYFVCCGEP